MIHDRRRHARRPRGSGDFVKQEHGQRLQASSRMAALALFLIAGLLMPMPWVDAAPCRGKQRRGCRQAVRHRVQGPCTAAAAKPAADSAQSLFDGKSLKGWTVADKFDFHGHGKVAVRNGRIELGEGRPATGIARSDKPPKINYELSLEAMRTDGFDFFCGLTFPVRDQYCTLIVGGWGGTVVGLSNVDSFPANENETTTYRNFKSNQWYRIRLRVTEQQINVWIDDEQLIELKTKDRKLGIWWEQEPMRPLGIATWYTSAALRKISLRRLDPPTP